MIRCWLYAILVAIFFCPTSLDIARAKTVTLEGELLSRKITGELLKPRGTGPFPAMVLLHGCSGILPGVERAWATRLIQWGYVVLLVDSFGPRKLHGGVCRRPGHEWVSRQTRGTDGYLALSYLSKLDYVRKDKIGVMGWSNGGVATLSAINTESSDFKAEVSQAKFSAAVAFYPECGLTYGKWKVNRGYGIGPVKSVDGQFNSMAPLLILIGSEDDWTLAKDCQSLIERSDDSKLSLIVYPGARHSFDGTTGYFYIKRAHNINKPGACCGATVGLNVAAKRDSIAKVRKYLGRHLGGDAPLSMSVIEVQRTLTALGFDPGPADGAWGANSLRALNAFLKSVGQDPVAKLHQQSVDLLKQSASN